MHLKINKKQIPFIGDRDMDKLSCWPDVLGQCRDRYVM